MVLSVPQLQNLTLRFMVEKIAEDRSRARVLELPDCVVEALTNEQAIEQLQKMVQERFTQAQVVSIEIEVSQSMQANDGWAKYAGVFKDDPYFAKVIEQMNAERQGED
jgi:hypothetical protein